MIDTHCHLTYRPLMDQVDAVLDRARQAGVDRMITVATSLTDARLAVELAGRFDHVYATAGIHPHEAGHQSEQTEAMAQLRQLAADPKVVAIGEMGLDRHYVDPPMSQQRRVFGWQLEAASTTTKPVIIHNRQATDDVLAMIGDSGIGGDRFVFHCFSGDDADLDAILDIGAMVSFTGIVTFKNAKALAACAKRVPMDRLMLETDAPYLTPEPHRKVRPNEPCYVLDVARFMATQRHMDEAELILNVDQNAQRFFSLDPNRVF